jgi:hypothetical protein
MEGNPEQQRIIGPEENERLTINSIVIPADEILDVRQDEIGASHLADYQRLVDGLIEHVSLDQPPSSMYFNEEGKLRGLPQNRRATLLLWMHNPMFRYADVVAGDALVVGPVDSTGHDTNASDELLQTIFQAKRFRAEVRTHDDGDWHVNQHRFDNWVDAYSYVLSLGWRWRSLADVRVVPEA